MKQLARITDDGTLLAQNIEVELELLDTAGHTWAGAFDAPRHWPRGSARPMRLHLADGRAGMFLATRQCGGDLGSPTVLFQGVEPLR